LELLPFKEILNFSFRAFSDGFVYLGYYLKTGPHRAADWDWLIFRFSQKITRWYNRWLSLGGRYVLIKYVLEAQPVFWMSMESVPRSIINKIHKVIFHYLWNGRNDSCQFHLCKWELLSRPKINGGWGFLNLYHFNLALNVVTLWRLLTQQSIWHQVMFDKYLHNTTLFNWLRQPTHNLLAVSRMWASLVCSLPIINHWISWNLGAGHHISIGRDKILGMGDVSLLSLELVEILNSK